MIIHKSSWHYKLIQLFEWEPRNGCEYGWKVFSALSILAVVVPTILFGMGLNAWLLFADLAEDANKIDFLFDTMGIEFLGLKIYVTIAAVVGAIAWVIVAAITFIVCVVGAGVGYETAKDKVFGPPKQGPSVFKQWWKAYKEKHCPIIEYKD